MTKYQMAKEIERVSKPWTTGSMYTLLIDHLTKEEVTATYNRKVLGIVDSQ